MTSDSNSNAMMSLIAIRDYVSTDENFVFKSALEGIYYGSTLLSKIKKIIFLSHYRNILRNEMALSTTRVKIACIASDPNEIKGFSILVNNEKALMWVFVKKDWRKHGMARALVPDTVVEVTNLSPVGESIIKKYPHVSFNPFVT